MKYEEGVSPVIAELLMIAITVVLVVAVYIMLTSGIITTPYGMNQLSGTLLLERSKSNHTSVYFDVILNHPSKTHPDQVKIIVVSSSKSTNLIYKGNFIWSNETSGGKWHYEAKLIDNDGDKEFSNVDSLIVSIVKDSSSANPPQFKNGDKVLFSIDTYSGSSAGGVVEF